MTVAIVSQNAWGSLDVDLGATVYNGNGQNAVRNMGNYECSVLVKGSDIQSMLGFGDWQELVPYDRSGHKYDHSDKPWNSRAF